METTSPGGAAGGLKPLTDPSKPMCVQEDHFEGTTSSASDSRPKTRRQTRMDYLMENIVFPSPTTSQPDGEELAGIVQGRRLHRRSTADAKTAQLELAGIKHFSGIVDPEGATATPATPTVPRWSLHLDRLAGCVECIPPFMTCLGEILHGPAGGGRRGSPGSYGPGTRSYGPDPTIDSVARAISESTTGDVY